METPTAFAMAKKEKAASQSQKQDQDQEEGSTSTSKEAPFRDAPEGSHAQQCAQLFGSGFHFEFHVRGGVFERVSPVSILPPGNSQKPAIWEPGFRRAAKTLLALTIMAAVTIIGLDIAYSIGFGRKYSRPKKRSAFRQTFLPQTFLFSYCLLGGFSRIMVPVAYQA